MEHKQTIPWRITEEGNLEYDKCSMYLNLSVDNTTVPCQYGYWYDRNLWDLVCGYEWLIELSMTISGVGSVVGAMVFNTLADRVGRKKVFLGCLWSNIITAMAMAFSPNITFYIILAAIDGMQQQGMVATSYILAVELFATEERTFPGNAIEFFWDNTRIDTVACFEREKAGSRNNYEKSGEEK
ncbi:hypothetical protein LSH36_3g24010 [Paralvinella palmiformis]|uniref:Uncharacterized protein n=1 Tax=Paralvinella palmiformis TaxID=53620 RepID=A0AAD9KFI2_9ANNE|nr:hypothetical protein LSH36_3g24010 [Paralvinella palmiformis]